MTDIMTDAITDATPPSEQTASKFLIFKSRRGLLTLPTGEEYEIRELRSHPTDPNNASSPVWYEGFVSANNTQLNGRDSILQKDFAKHGVIPDHRPPESNALPLQLKLNPYPADKKRDDGKSPHYIGSLLTSAGFYTVFAREMNGKNGLLLAGSVVPHQPRMDAANTPAPADAGEATRPDSARGPSRAKRTRDPA